MRIKTIAAAVAALAAGQAFALNPADSAAASKVWASGASAPTAIVATAFERLCETGTLTFYLSGATSLKDFNAYTCQIKAEAGTAYDGQNVAFMHTTKDGSFKSVEGMSTSAAKQVDFIKPDFSGCTLSGTLTVGGVTAPRYINCALAKRQSEGGFSDVEAPMWSSYVDEFPIEGVSLEDVVITSVPAGQAFMVAASRPLYEAMQKEQGLAAAGCTPDNITAACQPSISKRQYAAIVDASSPNATDFKALLAPNQVQPATARNVLCRRVDTSGTQASSNVFFLANPCAKFVDRAGAQFPKTSIDYPLGSSSFGVAAHAPGTGDVRECLSGADLSDSNTTVFGGTDADDWSIGVISAENPANKDAGEDWRPLKLDGTAIYDGAGNRKAVLDMKYDFAFELVLHTNPNITPAESESVFQAVVGQMGDATLPAITGLFRTADNKGTRGGNACSPFVAY